MKAGVKVFVAGALVCAAWLVVPGARAESGPPDPALPGPSVPVRVEYDAGPTTVNDPKGLPLYPAEIAGVLWYPKAMTGTHPVVLLLHGNHGTCDVAGAGGSAYPCPSVPPVVEPHRSYAGYDYLASNLASHGYITLSVDANAVNTYNDAGDKGANERAQLLARTLDAVSAWNTAAGPGDVGTALIGHVDMTRIGMMGHSRGGEGVTTFVDYNKTRGDGPHYAVSAVFSLAGTDYNLPTATGAVFGNLLPLCDGDVYDLQSSFPWDRGHVASIDSDFARVQFTVNGTNHNYFNTEWESDDYAGRPADAACSPTSKTTDRLSPVDQRRVGLDIIAAFMRRYVGGETAFDPYMTGAAAFPSSICPGATATCPNLVGHSYIAPASQRRYLISPVHAGDTLHLTAEGKPLTATGFATYSMCDPHADNGTDGNNRDPGTKSGCPTNPNRTRVRQLTLAWNGPASLRAELGDHDVSRFATLVMRAAVNFKDARNRAHAPQDFTISLIDGGGHRATVHAGALSNALIPPPGDAENKLTLNGIRVPLSAFVGVDLRNVSAVELGFTGTGSIELSQLALQELAPVVDAATLEGPSEQLPATGGDAPLTLLFGLFGAALFGRGVQRWSVTKRRA